MTTRDPLGRAGSSGHSRGSTVTCSTRLIQRLLSDRPAFRTICGDVIESCPALAQCFPPPPEDVSPMHMRVRDRVSSLFLIVAGSHLAALAQGGEPAPQAAKATAAEARAESFTAEQKGHWAYQPVERPEPPAVGSRAGSGTRSTGSSWPSSKSPSLPHAPRPIASP